MFKLLRKRIQDRRKSSGSVSIFTIISIVVSLIQLYFKYFTGRGTKPGTEDEDKDSSDQKDCDNCDDPNCDDEDTRRRRRRRRR